MSGNVIPFRRPAKPVSAVQRVTGLAVVLEAQPGAVCIVVGETELWPDPSQARTLVRDLSDTGYPPILPADGEFIVAGYYDGTNYRLSAGPEKHTRIVTVSGTTYTCVATDAASMLECTNAAGCAVTFPPVSSVPRRIGTSILATQSGAGQVTLVAAAGVTLETSETLKTLKQSSVTGATMLATNRWRVFGEREFA